MNIKGNRMSKLKEITKERKFKYISFFWCLVSIQLILGYNMQTTGHLFSSRHDVLMCIIKFILISILFITLHYFIIEFVNQINSKRANTQKEKKNIKNKKYDWIKYFLIIFICWIPTLLAFYPAIIGYDGPSQIKKMVFDNRMTRHPLYIQPFMVLG